MHRSRDGFGPGPAQNPTDLGCAGPAQIGPGPKNFGPNPSLIGDTDDNQNANLIQWP